jgi:ribosome-binding protein aMBF1 (putative translation factor)
LKISINPANLIELAKIKSGKQLQEMAEELHIDKTRISKLKSGRLSFNITEGFYFSKLAGIPFEEVARELEQKRDPETAVVWDRLGVREL